MTHRLNLKHIAIKFQDTPYGYLIVASTRIVWKKSNQREVYQKVRQGEQLTGCLDLIHIAMKFHSGIPNGYRVMMRTNIVCKTVIKGQ